MARISAQQKFGKRVRSLRLDIGLTQEELSFKTGLDRTYISGIERGKRNPSLRNIERLAKALRVKTHELI